VPGAPLFVCKMFSFLSNRICHAPKLSPDARLVAFGTADTGGKLCQTPYGLFWADYVVVRDRAGAELVRHEGFHSPEWLADGRLLMLGSQCRGAGVWVSGPAQAEPTRIDGGQVATPARLPAVSPDGRKLALVWNNQLWTLGLDGERQLEQITRFDKAVAAAAWSPDGKAMALLLWDVALPVRALVLARPGSPDAPEVRPLGFYPFGPISWR
jgi:Tol biopolymer transport system component